mmetsp:Transcript_22728/g.73452  ORF Transcript_22728/g.73452 Transcript_22728/m.73452 type:complete len:246 (-) Transcript_22728:446-1183(-)
MHRQAAVGTTWVWMTAVLTAAARPCRQSLTRRATRTSRRSSWRMRSSRSSPLSTSSSPQRTAKRAVRSCTDSLRVPLHLCRATSSTSWRIAMQTCRLISACWACLPTRSSWVAHTWLPDSGTAALDHSCLMTKALSPTLRACGTCATGFAWPFATSLEASSCRTLRMCRTRSAPSRRWMPRSAQRSRRRSSPSAPASTWNCSVVRRQHQGSASCRLCSWRTTRTPPSRAPRTSQTRTTSRCWVRL